MNKTLYETAADLIDEEPQLAREITRQWLKRHRSNVSAYGLTVRQREVLDFIENYAKEHNGLTPTYEEICVGAGIDSKGRVYRIVEALDQRGYIVRMFNRPRSIRLADEVGQ